jgi:hypothetical protein
MNYGLSIADICNAILNFYPVPRLKKTLQDTALNRFVLVSCGDSDYPSMRAWGTAIVIKITVHGY